MINIEKKDKISLIKKREEKISVILSKKTQNQISAQVALVMDISGSMRKLYKSGVVQNILERIYPLATKFDDDGSLDMWIFSHSFNKLSAVVEENFDTYIEAEILNKKPSSSWGRTEYAPVMEDVISTYKYSKIPAYVIFITDGQNSDKTKTKQALIEASNYPIFWQYVGIGFEEFEFLKRLDELKGRAIDNANFFQLNDIMSVSDEELYNRLLNEFPDWYKEIHKNS